MKPEEFRDLVKEVSGRNIYTVEAEEFLGIFQQDLDAVLNEATRAFIEKHFGKK